MDEIVDLEARERIAKLYTITRELGSALWGDDRTRDNGIRSEVRTLEDMTGELDIAMRTLKADLQHYLDKDREQTCIGLKALAEYITRCEAMKMKDLEEETEVTVARVNARGTTQAAQWQFWAMFGSQLLTMAALIIFILTGVQLPKVSP